MLSFLKIPKNNFFSLRNKLIFLLLTVSLIPLILVGVITYFQAQAALETAIINKLVAVRDIKAHQIIEYFQERIGDVTVLSHNPTTTAAMQAFDEAFHHEEEKQNQESHHHDDTEQGINALFSQYLGHPERIDAGDGSQYSQVHAQYHQIFKNYKEIYGYYDLFLIEIHSGIIVYSVTKEIDFGTSLENGPYANTSLSRVFHQTKKATESDFTQLEDFTYYEPSQEPASFLTAPIFQGVDLIGVLAVQLPINQIDEVMQEKTGLGLTGETILIGLDDFLLRSNSRFFKDNTILKQKVDTEATRAAAEGETGLREIIDYRGELAIIAYTPLNIPGVKWSLNAKVDKAEAFQPIQEMLQVILLIIAVGIIMTIGIAFLFAHSIAKPIRTMTEIASQLAAGDLDLTLEVKSRDEIGLMSQAFQQMIGNLRLVTIDIVQLSQGLGEGHLSVTPNTTYQGDFARIQEALELALSNLRAVIKDIVHVSQGLAAGNLNVTPQSEYRGDFIQIKTALETALLNQRQVIRDIVQISQGLAEGYLNVTPQSEYQGDFIQIKQAQEIALTNQRQVIEDIVQVSQSLANGDLNIVPQADYQGDFVRIKTALVAAAAKLRETTQLNTSQDWLKTGQNQVNEQMSGEQNIVELTHNIVSFLTLYMEAQVGICYLIDNLEKNDNKLKLVASYAFARGKNLAEEFQFSEGLVERAIKELKTILISIQADLGETIPQHLIVTPFLYENRVKGVIVLGSLKPFTELQQEFFHQVMPSIGIAVNAIESRTQMQILLDKTQIQADELENQKEELQHQKEELQSQAEELQAQTEELQSQTEELRHTNEELEERTHELERQRTEVEKKNETLEQTRHVLQTKAEELELASQYKSEFLANMSHELRTPLNSLLILAQLLAENKDGNLNDKQQEYAQTIHHAGSDLLSLINDILDLSKVEAGKMEIHVEDISLTQLLSTIEQKFRPLAENKALTFHIKMDEDLSNIISTDEQRVKQIINNLLSNAFKFTSEGEIQLLIQSPSEQDELAQMGLASEQLIAIRIMDTGVGIPMDKQKVIFEAFQQVDGTTSRRFGGTGLGLSISRQLARLLGGEIRLVSQEGQGSTFTLYLPKCHQKHKSLEEPTPSISVQEQPNPAPSLPAAVADSTNILDDRNSIQSEDKLLLIVEDDNKFSKILLELAHEKDFKCLMAADGKTGVQLAQQYLPQAIILDVSLPLLDGWSVMEILKDNPETRHIPVHFMSAADESIDAKKMGAIGYLHKPVNMVELGRAFKKIEQFIANRLKNLLVIVENQSHQQQILEMVEGEEIQTTLISTQSEALQQLHQTAYDCIILDLEVEQGTGIEILDALQKEEQLNQIPVIIYTDRNLTTKEDNLLQRYANRLTVKMVCSQERLLDEATLFLHQVEAKLPKEKRHILNMIHDKSAILRDKKVLIVDDDMRNMFALATVLEEYNMEVIGGKNGKEALALLEENPDITIILMDVMMPEMDGYEAIRQIRKQTQFRQLPIIALTAKAMKGDKAKCIEAGANDYLSKPVDPNKLISLMRVWLYR